MKILEIGIVSIFAFSIFTNICYIFFNRQLDKYTFRWDLFRWISVYRLFSETPRFYRLFYRDKLENHELTEWQEIPLSVERRWYQMFVFPRKLVSDGINSIVDDLVRIAEAGHKADAVSQSFQCQTILLFTKGDRKTGHSTDRQIKILESCGHISNEQERELFISKFHNV